MVDQWVYRGGNEKTGSLPIKTGDIVWLVHSKDPYGMVQKILGKRLFKVERLDGTLTVVSHTKILRATASCSNCSQPATEHQWGRCLFAPTRFSPRTEKKDDE